MARVIRTREALEALRQDVLKAQGKPVRTQDYASTYKLPNSYVGWLVKIKAVEDVTPANMKKKDGKILKWIYTKTGETGPVDTKLAQALLDCQSDYFRKWRQKKLGTSTPTVIKIEDKVLERLPSRKDDKMEMVNVWLKDKLNKNKQVPGYIRQEEVVMYNKMIDVLDGLKEVAEALKKINI